MPGITMPELRDVFKLVQTAKATDVMRVATSLRAKSVVSKRNHFSGKNPFSQQVRESITLVDFHPDC
jgi:hypothetical protein